jgi:mRNA interferase RelE/StbE
MSYQFIFTPKAEEDLGKLDSSVIKRTIKKIIKLQDYTDISHVATSLTGDFQKYCRIRVGQYRLVCVVEDGVITILRIQHRREVYRK